MLFLKKIDKYEAFSIHLVTSGLIIGCVFYLLLGMWYPKEFFIIDGGWKGIKLIAIVDLVIGPLLTLIIYRKNKKGLFWDMSIIGILQLTFLVYGIWTLYVHRPAALVFYKDRFYSMGVEKYTSQEDGLIKLKEIAGDFPAHVYVHLPENWEEKMSLRKKATLKGEALFAQIEFYLPLKDKYKEIIIYGRDVEDYFSDYPEQKKVFDEWLSIKDKKIDDYIYIPVVSRFKHTLLALDPDSGTIDSCVDVDMPLETELPYLNFQ